METRVCEVCEEPDSTPPVKCTERRGEGEAEETEPDSQTTAVTFVIYQTTLQVFAAHTIQLSMINQVFRILIIGPCSKRHIIHKKKKQ